GDPPAPSRGEGRDRRARGSHPLRLRLLSRRRRYRGRRGRDQTGTRVMKASRGEPCDSPLASHQRALRVCRKEPACTSRFSWCVILSENRYPLFGITHGLVRGLRRRLDGLRGDVRLVGLLVRLHDLAVTGLLDRRDLLVAAHMLRDLVALVVADDVTLVGL